MTVEKKIRKIVKNNFSEEESFLVKLTETNSVNSLSEGNPSDPNKAIELAVARLIRKELRSMGVQSEYIGLSKKRPNVVGVVGPSRSRKNLIFNAHMDTAEPIGAFRGDPFTPFKRGRKFYGLGVLNSKAMIAAFVYTAKALKELGMPMSGKLMLQFVVDGLSGGESRLGTKYLLSRGVKAKAAVLGYAGEVVGIGHRGGYRFKLTTKGEEIPTSSREWQEGDKGKNAISEMFKAVNALDDWELPYKPARAFPNRKPMFTFPTKIQGGSQVNVVPKECMAMGDVRLMPGNSDRQVRLRIIEKLDGVRNLKYKMEDLVYVPAVEIDQKEEIVQVLADESAGVLGNYPKIEGIGSWNNGWMFIKKDIPAVVQLPLVGGQYRGNHEWVSMTSLMQLTEILTRTAVSFLGMKKD